jgi:hypothetical protein
MSKRGGVLARFVVLYGMLYCAFGFASPFLPALLADVRMTLGRPDSLFLSARDLGLRSRLRWSIWNRRILSLCDLDH